MHIVFGKVLKYSLWFIFCVIWAAFLYGFAKFDFNTTLYIEYLNGINVKQLFVSPVNTQTWSVITGELLSGEQNVYDSSLEDEMFGQTGTQVSGSTLTGSTTESFGFVKESETTGNDTKKPIISSGTTTLKTSSPTISGDAKKQLLNLIKSREK